MAHMSQDHKKEIAAVIKPILKAYGIKATLSVRHHSTLCLNIKSGKIDFGEGGVNVYWIEDHYKDRPLAKEFLLKVKAALYGPRYFDKSDIQSDYFHCSHYVEINIGKWDKAYILEK